MRKREIVAARLDEGVSRREIAAELGISRQAVGTHVQRLGFGEIGAPDWGGAEIEVLRRGWGEGLSARKIATMLPYRSKNAVIGQAHRLGLERRPSPIVRK